MVRTKRGSDALDDAMKPIFLRFTFNNFEELPYQRGDSKAVEKWDYCNSNGTWELELYPGGYSDANSEQNSVGDVFVELGLKKTSGCEVDAKVSFTLRDANGSVFEHTQMDKSRYGGYGGGQSWGINEWVRRSRVLSSENNILSNDALVIDVEIQFISGKRTKFQPTNPAFKNIQQLCECDDHSDVQFKVAEEVIPTHKLILTMNAPLLAEFCGKKKIVTINDTSPDVFRIVLRYVYGKDAPDADVVLTKDKEIIEAANRYEIVSLKMAVEKTLVEQQVINLRNVADWLVFADSTTCALLKEHALAYFKCRAKDVLAHKSSADLKESPQLLQEVILAMSSNLPDASFDQNSKMSVDELRKKLEGKGLDVDGSKEALVLRLTASEQSN
mmetsp:Transcript_27963/g.52266  ORF Transcript_27963/g.52266 Transcript_27963/m.52266 type:complete len:387 (-) Transcript_27963:223-1383(-)